MKWTTVAVAVLACAAVAQETEARPKDRPDPARRAQAARHIHAFLKRHPRLRRELVQRFDENGDGKLAGHERAAFAHHLQALRHKLDADGNGQLSKHELKRMEDVMRRKHAKRGRDEIKDRFDKNGDGELGRRERRHARRVRDRLDRNDDGRVGPRERRAAKRVKDRLDKNGDGELGRRERHHARRVRDRLDRDDDEKVERREVRRARKARERADRNDDGRVGPRERKRARKVRKAHRTNRPRRGGR